MYIWHWNDIGEIAMTKTNEQVELKACGCGKTPKELFIYGDDAKYKWAYGSCCGDWHIEFRTGYHRDGSKELMEAARYMWNMVSRPQPTAQNADQQHHYIFYPEENRYLCAKCGQTKYCKPDDNKEGKLAFGKEEIRKLILDELDNEDTYSDLMLEKNRSVMNCFEAVAALAAGAIFDKFSQPQSEQYGQRQIKK